MIGTDFEKLDLIHRVIGHLRRRLTGKTLAAFRTDIDEVDLTAFRLAVIGEASAKLSDSLKARHAHIPWPKMYGMRNVIVHDYGAVAPERLWVVVEHDLDTLVEMCRIELGSH